MLGLRKPTAVVAHDAGAANIILAWLGAEGLQGIRPVMKGPAEQLWAARFDPGLLCQSLEQAVAGAAAVLTGTGWASTLEHDARRLARAAGVRSVAVIDHWVNYAARFERDNETILPDLIWVTDEYALAMAHDAFPAVPITVQPNLYLAAQATKAGSVPADGDLLFVSEPARDKWGRDVQGEFQALDFLIKHMSEAAVPAGVPLRIRAHPSDPVGKYERWITAHPGATLDGSPDMANALRGARWVAGLQSFGMTIALKAGRVVISALPPWAPPCALPHKDIIHLSQRINQGRPSIPL